MCYIDSFSNKWYYHLVPDLKGEGKCLFDYISRSSIVSGSNLVIQVTPTKTSFLFSVFKDYLDFYIYQNKFKIESRNFFETILGEKAQKVYFDIDIDINTDYKQNDEVLVETSGEKLIISPEDIKSEVIKCIILTFQEFAINLEIDKDIIVCTSHSNEKKSYHIIVDNYQVPNCNYNKIIYNIVVSKMRKDYIKFIGSLYKDVHVDLLYKSVQQFRLLGSQKKGSGRIKIFNDGWYFFDDKINYNYPSDLTGGKYLYQFARTLITNTHYCRSLDFIDLNKYSLELSKFTSKINKARSGIPLTENLANLALLKLGEYAGMSINDPYFPYKIRSLETGYICLRRVRPSQCRICTTDDKHPVVHENEHPYMSISQNGNIYFDCRRSRNHGDHTHKTLCIGNVGSNKMDEIRVHTESDPDSDGENTEYGEIDFNKNNKNNVNNENKQSNIITNNEGGLSQDGNNQSNIIMSTAGVLSEDINQNIQSNIITSTREKLSQEPVSVIPDEKELTEKEKRIAKRKAEGLLRLKPGIDEVQSGKNGETSTVITRSVDDLCKLKPVLTKQTNRKKKNDY